MPSSNREALPDSVLYPVCFGFYFPNPLSGLPCDGKSWTNTSETEGNSHLGLPILLLELRVFLEETSIARFACTNGRGIWLFPREKYPMRSGE